MTQRKCQLCSRLLSTAKKFFSGFFGKDIDCQGISAQTNNHDQRVEEIDSSAPDCQGIHTQTYNHGQRVDEIDSAAPDCACEKFRMSVHSPGVVEDSEKLARYLYHPLLVDKKGNLKPNAFSHVHSKGCSIQREDIADTKELVALVRYFLNEYKRQIWMGVVFAQCQEVRNIMIDDSKRRMVCVYDTAEPDNPAHAEICQTRHVEDGEENELREKLFVIFGGGKITAPLQYRNGDIWNGLEQPLQRTI